MRRSRPVSIKTKIILICMVVIVLPITVMTISSYRSSERLLERNYKRIMEDLGYQTSIRIDDFLKKIEKISLLASTGLSGSQSATGVGSDPVQDFLREGGEPNTTLAYNNLMTYIMMEDRVFSIYLYNLNGGPDLIVSPNSPVHEAYNVETELWYKKFMHDKERTITLTTRVDEQIETKPLAVSHARKIYDSSSGALLGVIVVSIDIKFVENVNRNLQDTFRSNYMIVDSEDKIVYSRNESLIGTLFRANVRPDEKRNIVVTNRLGQKDWMTYLYMPKGELTNEGRLLGRNLLLLAGLMVLFAAIVSSFLSSVIARPMKKLMNNIVLVEKGHFERVQQINARDEFGQLSQRFNKMADELKRLVGKIQQDEIEKAKTEIRALHSQINPHFLYNTLGSLKWIAAMQQSDKIVDMTEALISMLRYASRLESPLVTIREELDNVDNYITIQNVRYYDSIQIRREIEEPLLDYRIPKMILQPIIENAIFHGFAELEEEGCITIRIYSIQADVAIEIHDNGAGMEEETVRCLLESWRTGTEAEARGIGLFNVQRRIKLHFGERYGIGVASSPGEGTTFTFLLPGIS
ncbi:cache domain-containing sensor histidine kinase [Paenibacillus pasadenensis]|uniref:histidine kinase n=1 Tax=Paenibacillus pasadenensis TaxID=217090 RepID=A0A2N5N4Z2_9BACL|nr:sensor histidine kinase [Paenibacillus pasadenensis]PLT45370.1 two-component sensor histidine kinase [Paenibacillus pasadenensis]